MEEDDEKDDEDDDEGVRKMMLAKKENYRLNKTEATVMTLMIIHVLAVPLRVIIFRG